MSWDASRPSNTRAARTMRDRILREQPVCAEAGCTSASTQDDHIVPWSQREARGLTIPQWHSRSNHRGLCEPHHDMKTKAEAAAGRANRSVKRKPRRHPADV